MDEAEWLSCTDPMPMLEFLRGKASDRKLRLFACACCHLVWELLADERSRRAVEFAEQFADGLTAKKVLKAGRRAALLVRADRPQMITADYRWGPGYAAEAAYRVTLGPHEAARQTVYQVAVATGYGARGVEQDARFRVDRDRCLQSQAVLLRHVFGNPFRPVTCEPSWLSDNALSLARRAYDTRDFTPLPILADALQDAGCEDHDVLTHLRGDGPHVRGCWVVDLILGKA